MSKKSIDQMSETQPKAKKPVELTEDEMDNVQGGGDLTSYDGMDGESADRTDGKPSGGKSIPDLEW